MAIASDRAGAAGATPADRRGGPVNHDEHVRQIRCEVMRASVTETCRRIAALEEENARLREQVLAMRRAAG